MNELETIITQLELTPHPEGGYYRETHRSKMEMVPEGFSGTRNVSTAIYYLLPAGAFSAFHRIQSDELWHFYEGIPLEVYVIMPDGKLEILQLGREINKGETYQAMVPAGCWFASRPVGVKGYALVGCTVAPGFDFQDFTMANRRELINQYPQHEQIVTKLTRD